MGNLGIIVLLVGIVVLVIAVLRHRKSSKKKPSRTLTLSGIALIIIGFVVFGMSPDNAKMTKEQAATASSKKISESKKAESSSKAAASSKKAAASSKKLAASESKSKAKKATNESKKKAATKKKDAAESKAAASSKKVAAKKAAATKAKAKINKINIAIAKSLKEDQGFANGTLDENGHPTKNGTKNPNFEWATYVSKITFNSKDRTVTAHVGAATKALTKEAKSQFALKCQNLAVATLVEMGKDKDDEATQGLFTNIKVGSDTVTQSHITNFKEFHIYQ